MRFTANKNSLYFNPMKTRHSIVILLAALFLATGCFRNDIRTVVFDIEQLRTPQAAQLLANSLRKLNGIQEFRPDLENNTLTVAFNGRELYLKNIEYAIVETGFDLPHWPAKEKEKLKLPEELR